MRTSRPGSPPSSRHIAQIMEPTGLGIGHVSMRIGRPTLKRRKREANATLDIFGNSLIMLVENIYNHARISKSAPLVNKKPRNPFGNEACDLVGDSPQRLRDIPRRYRMTPVGTYERHVIPRLALGVRGCRRPLPISAVLEIIEADTRICFWALS